MNICLPFAFSLGLLSISGCALISKGEPLSLRFYSPHSVAAADRIAAANADATANDGTVPGHVERLRLGQVEGASHLEQHMAYRDSESELAYSQALRWTELPDEYLRHALTEEFFDRRGARRILSGPGPILDVELQSFEELRFGKPRVRVAFRFVLRDEHSAVAEHLVQVERAIERSTLNEPDHAAQVAEAMSLALESAVKETGDRVARALAAETTRGSDAPAAVRQSEPRQSAPAPLSTKTP